MEWTDQAKKKFEELLLQIPANMREQTKDGIIREAERFANEKHVYMINVAQVVAGYILATPAYQREEIKARLKQCGIDWYKYRELFNQ